MSCYSLNYLLFYYLILVMSKYIFYNPLNVVITTDFKELTETLRSRRTPLI